jgi:hypothetical protein
MKYGTAPQEPDARQLVHIKEQLKAILDSGKIPTPDEWRKIVHTYCPSAGKYRYAGIDNSDLTTLLKLATKNP